MTSILSMMKKNISGWGMSGIREQIPGYRM